MSDVVVEVREFCCPKCFAIHHEYIFRRTSPMSLACRECDFTAWWYWGRQVVADAARQKQLPATIFRRIDGD